MTPPYLPLVVFTFITLALNPQVCGLPGALGMPELDWLVRCSSGLETKMARKGTTEQVWFWGDWSKLTG